MVELVYSWGGIAGLVVYGLFCLAVCLWALGTLILIIVGYPDHLREPGMYKRVFLWPIWCWKTRK